MRRNAKRIFCISMMVIMFISCCSTASFASSSTKTTKLYDECIKSGDYVYCLTYGGIYKVNIKKKTKRCLARIDSPSYEGFEGMKLYKGYIYAKYTAMEDEVAIFKIKATGSKSVKVLADFYGYDSSAFAISNSKIYYTGYSDYDMTKKFKKKMTLSGKSKVKTSIKAKNIYRHTTNKRYHVRTKYLGGDRYKQYLTTKYGTITLTTVEMD